MNIAILSGKGGTGKTTVSTNLALTLGIAYVDGDVEEPNGFLFLSPKINSKEDVYIQIPFVNEIKCSLCGECAKICQFHALAKAGKDIVLFEKLCHGCEACKLVCREGAISFQNRIIGFLEKGKKNDISCLRGVLNVGEPMAVPVIKALLEELPKEDHLIDCPPGTSCNVVTALRYSNAAILVTEPSQFGLHDMKMAIDLVKQFGIPFGVIINKDNGSDNLIKAYCRENKLLLLGTIPFSKEAATLYSKGNMLYENEQYRKIFLEIAQKIREVTDWN